MNRQSCMNMNEPPTMNWFYNNYQAGSYHHHQDQVPYQQGYYGTQGEQMWHHHINTNLPHELYAGMPQVQVSGYPATGGQRVETQLPLSTITVSGSEMSSPGRDASPPMMVNSNGRPKPARSPYEWIKRTNYTTGTGQESTRNQTNRYRQVYSKSQRQQLEQEYQNGSKYLSPKRKAELVSLVGLSERQVKMWFQNRRAKDSKCVRDMKMKGPLPPCSSEESSTSSFSNTSISTSAASNYPFEDNNISNGLFNPGRANFFNNGGSITNTNGNSLFQEQEDWFQSLLNGSGLGVIDMNLN